jgi:hypothetical protein
MKRFLLSVLGSAVAVSALALALAPPASSRLAPPAPTDIIAPYCMVLDSNLHPVRPPVVPANQPLTLYFPWASANRGLDMDWINGTELALTIDGVAYTNLNAYYQFPGDLHWLTGNADVDSLWLIPWAFPLPFQLAPGDSFTYTFTTTLKHRLLDGASPNPDGPGNRPYFFDPIPATPTTCTVTTEP